MEDCETLLSAAVAIAVEDGVDIDALVSALCRAYNEYIETSGVDLDEWVEERKAAAGS